MGLKNLPIARPRPSMLYVGRSRNQGELTACLHTNPTVTPGGKDFAAEARDEKSRASAAPAQGEQAQEGENAPGRRSAALCSFPALVMGMALIK